MIFFRSLPITSSCNEHFFSCFQRGSGLAEIRKTIEIAEKCRLLVSSVFLLGGNPGYFKESGDIARKYPSFFLGGKSFNGLSGIIVRAYSNSGKKCTFRYIRDNREKRRPLGTYFSCGDIKVATLTGFLAQAKNGQGKSAGIYAAYSTALELIEKSGFGINNVCRFWNFLHGMPDYKELNKGRDRFFSEHSVTSYPAATGIQALHPDGAYYQLGLEAVRSDNAAIEREVIHSSLQCDAWQYGPKFSRAVLIRAEKELFKKLYVSGTSSIDCAGKSVKLCNARKNITYVVSCVEHILRKKDMGLENIAMSVVYCKTAELFNLFESIYAKRKWNFPYVPLITDICRNELFFEIECMAAGDTKSDTFSGSCEY